MPSIALAACLIAALALYWPVIAVRLRDPVARYSVLGDPVDSAEASHACTVSTQVAVLALLAFPLREDGTTSTFRGVAGAAARGGFIVKELPERELSRTEIAVSVADHVCPCDFPKLLGHLERHPRSFGLAFSALGGKPVKAAVCTELLELQGTLPAFVRDRKVRLQLL